MASQGMTALATITIGTAAGSVTFSNIPTSAVYRDLRLVIAGANSDASSLYIQMNGDTGTNYNDVSLSANGSTASGGARTNNARGYIGVTDSATSNLTTVDFIDYSTTDRQKIWLSRGNASGSRVESRAGRWANTSALSTLLVATDTNTFSVGCVISLYGIAG